MLSSHLILCCTFLFLPSIFPSFRVFFNKSVLCISHQSNSKYFLILYLWSVKCLESGFCKCSSVPQKNIFYDYLEISIHLYDLISFVSSTYALMKQMSHSSVVMVTVTFSMQFCHIQFCVYFEVLLHGDPHFPNFSFT